MTWGRVFLYLAAGAVIGLAVGTIGGLLALDQLVRRSVRL